MCYEVKENSKQADTGKRAVRGQCPVLADPNNNTDLVCLVSRLMFFHVRAKLQAK